MKIDFIKVIFWTIFASLFVSVLITESDRVEQNRQIRLMKSNINLLFEGEGYLMEHTHYYNSFPKPSLEHTPPK